jgi:hypothetical protein
MSHQLHRIGVFALVFVISFSLSRFASARVPADAASDDIAVQTRGPVHEAFAQPANVNPQPGATVPKNPPDPISEEPPDQEPDAAGVQWIPGYWAWDVDRKDFLWVSGSWRVPPPNRKWVPGAWTHVDGGWQWVPGFWAADSQQEVTYQDAPPASLEDGPSVPATDDDSTYVPGNWIYRDSRYVWRPGYWLAAQPGYVWSPAHYCYTPSGYIYVDGYWDYPLEDRGLLFAPVIFNRPLWRTPGWYYTPDYCLYGANLFDCLFFRTDYCCYFFGDYFGPTYGRLGFRPWFSGGWRDPLFGYYRWFHHRDGNWERNLRRDFAARTRGDLERPPRTLADQITFRSGSANHLRTIQRLNEVRDSHVRLTTVSRTQLDAQRQSIDRFREVSRSRQTVESSGRTGTGGRPTLSLDHVPRPATHGPEPARPQHVTPPATQVTPPATRPQRPPSPTHVSPDGRYELRQPQVVQPAAPAHHPPPDHLTPPATRPQHPPSPTHVSPDGRYELRQPQVVHPAAPAHRPPPAHEQPHAAPVRSVPTAQTPARSAPPAHTTPRPMPPARSAPPAHVTPHPVARPTNHPAPSPPRPVPHNSRPAPSGGGRPSGGRPSEDHSNHRQ